MRSGGGAADEAGSLGNPEPGVLERAFNKWLLELFIPTATQVLKRRKQGSGKMLGSG